MDFGKSLRVAMAYRNVRQAELRKSVQISHCHLSQIVNGHKEPSMKVTKQICDALGYKVSEFIALGEE